MNQEKVQFLGYIVFLQGICMEDERIKVVKE